MNAPYFIEYRLPVEGGSWCEVREIVKDFRLPCRECSSCKERGIHFSLTRYDLPIPAAINPRAINRIHTLPDVKFDQLVRSVSSDLATQAVLLPGTRLGSPSFRLKTEATDYLMERAGFLVSERVLDAVTKRGVEVAPLPVPVEGRRKKVYRYFSLMPKICRVTDEAWLNRRRIQCPVCLEWNPRWGIQPRKEDVIPNAQIVRERWPGFCGIVYDPSLGSAIFSAEFVEAFQDAKLTGAAFAQANWV